MAPSLPPGATAATLSAAPQGPSRFRFAIVLLDGSNEPTEQKSERLYAALTPASRLGATLLGCRGTADIKQGARSLRQHPQSFTTSTRPGVKVAEAIL